MVTAAKNGWKFRGAGRYEPAPSEMSPINSLPGRRTCCSRLVAKSALLEEFVHWFPIRFDPSARMTLEAVRWYADLREAKLRATIQLAQVKRGN